MTSASKSLRPDIQYAHEAVRTLLAYIGEDPDREGLRDTPQRVVKAWVEMTSGTFEDPVNHLKQCFAIEDGNCDLGIYDQLILSKDIPFVSNCEHHMLPFIGNAHVAYIPTPESRVVGLSKLARLVEAYALRLQIQERLTQQIADALQSELKPRGAAVIIKAQHTCQCNRGIKKNGYMVTSAFYGLFKEQSSTRMEFLELLKV